MSNMAFEPQPAVRDSTSTGCPYAQEWENAQYEEARVPPRWLSLPADNLNTSFEVPPCSASVRDAIYEPLDANPQRFQIRLLVIEDQDDEHGRLSCMLHHVLLKDAPEYCALSYCWNDNPHSAPHQIILINGLEFTVRPNLLDALHSLRQKGRFILWIDALCLNQQDNEEKAQQVPRMCMIYRQAASVAVWLGREAQGSSELLDLVQRIARTPVVQLVQSNKEMQTPLWHKTTMFTLQSFVREGLPLAYSAFKDLLGTHLQRKSRPDAIARNSWSQMPNEALAQLCAFFNRPFWRRTWIIQEVATAQRVDVFCGDTVISWKDLASLRFIDDGMKEWNEVADISRRNMAEIERLRYKIDNRIPVGFLTALQRSCAFETGNPLDKFYALIGLCWDADRYIPIVSYANDFTRNSIMFDMMKRWIVQTGNIDLICLQPHFSDNDLTLPTWLPKWLAIGRSSISDRLLDHLENRQAFKLLSRHGHSWMATQRSKNMMPQFYDHNRIMHVAGVQIDVIDGLSAACDSKYKDRSLLQAWHSNIESTEYRTSDETIRTCLYWTLNLYKAQADIILRDEIADVDILFSDKIRCSWRDEGRDYHSRWLDGLRTFRIFGKSLEQQLLGGHRYNTRAKIAVINAMIPTKGDMGLEAKHRESVKDAFCQVFKDGRRLMTTKAGRIGWAHPSARPGDLIYLLEGCHLPVILAPSRIPFEGSQTYAVIVDAYMHGAMKGELWPNASQHLAPIFFYVEEADPPERGSVTNVCVSLHCQFTDTNS